MEYIDLHVHSNRSDGTFTVQEIIEYAVKKGLKAIALTDHDTVDGVDEAVLYAKDYNIEVIPGIEMSSDYKGTDLHILGLNIDYQNEEFNNFVDKCRLNRYNRNLKMAEKLRSLGIDIDASKLQEIYGNAAITRAHYARYLVENGYVKDKDTAFKKYLGKGCPGYVPKITISPKEAIDIIKVAKGHPILAHPLLYKYSKVQLDSLFDYLKGLGLEGIEGIYSLHTVEDELMLKKMAKSHGLYITGGSDFHGGNKPDIDLGTGKGNLKIPYELIENIR